MNILIVGGTGMAGADAAVRLAGLGHRVTIAARKPPGPETLLGCLSYHRFDYIVDSPDLDWLGNFEAVVFAATNDVRHVPHNASGDADWAGANTLAVPRFFRAIKAAGGGRAILIGSFYPQAVPHLIRTNAYVSSRFAAEQEVLALADHSFTVIALNAPWIIGEVPGIVSPLTRSLARWALGHMPSVPRTAGPGGTNIMTTDSVTDAIVGGLSRGENGVAYLLGGENLTFQGYFGLYFQACGDRAPLPVVAGDHPFLPTSAVLAGPGSTTFYDPDPASVALLGYRQGGVQQMVERIVDAERARLGAAN